MTDARLNQSVGKMIPGTRDYKGAQPVNATSTTVLKPSAGGGCFTLIQRLIADGTSGVFAFDVPQNFHGLQLELHGADGSTTADTGITYIHFNGDEANNYRWNISQLESTGFINIDHDNDWGIGFDGVVHSGGDFPQAPGFGVCYIPDYTNTTFWKMTSAWCGGITTNNTGAIYGGYSTIEQGHWRSTAAITHIKVRCQDDAGGVVFLAGTELSVFGKC